MQIFETGLLSKQVTDLGRLNFSQSTPVQFSNSRKLEDGINGKIMRYMEQ